VAYAQGRCQMPFTDKGPPMTGFENTIMVGTMMQKGRASGRKAVPNASIAKRKTHGRIRRWFGFQEDNNEGWSANESHFVQRAAVSVANGSNFRSEEDSDDAGVVDMREGTDLTLPEEDVLIKGGTGPNATINGLYFKLSATYGMPIYKMAKMESKFFYGVPIARFLYFDTKTNIWVISALPNEGPKEQPGYAYVDDPDATHPGAIEAEWYVYHPDDNKMRQFGGAEEDEEDDESAGASSKMIASPVDQIKCVSILGFELTGVDKTLIKAGSMVRHSRELYGRPVYVSESDDQYLYWFRKSGDLTQGLLDDHLESDAVADPSSLFKYKGHWIIARQVGERYDGPTCLAYLEDPAVSPDQIPQGSSWYVAVSQKEPGNPKAGYRYERSSVFGLILQESDLSGSFKEG